MEHVDALEIVLPNIAKGERDNVLHSELESHLDLPLMFRYACHLGELKMQIQLWTNKQADRVKGINFDSQSA